MICLKKYGHIYTNNRSSPQLMSHVVPKLASELSPALISIIFQRKTTVLSVKNQEIIHGTSITILEISNRKGKADFTRSGNC